MFQFLHVQSFTLPTFHAVASAMACKSLLGLLILFSTFYYIVLKVVNMSINKCKYFPNISGSIQHFKNLFCFPVFARKELTPIYNTINVCVCAYMCTKCIISHKYVHFQHKYKLFKISSHSRMWYFKLNVIFNKNLFSLSTCKRRNWDFEKSVSVVSWSWVCESTVLVIIILFLGVR